MTKTEMRKVLAVELAEIWEEETALKFEIQELEKMENTEKTDRRTKIKYRMLWEKQALSNHTLKMGNFLGLDENKLRELAWTIYLENGKKNGSIVG